MKVVVNSDWNHDWFIFTNQLETLQVIASGTCLFGQTLVQWEELRLSCRNKVNKVGYLKHEDESRMRQICSSSLTNAASRETWSSCWGWAGPPSPWKTSYRPRSAPPPRDQPARSSVCAEIKRNSIKYVNYSAYSLTWFQSENWENERKSIFYAEINKYI